MLSWINLHNKVQKKKHPNHENTTREANHPNYSNQLHKNDVRQKPNHEAKTHIKQPNKQNLSKHQSTTQTKIKTDKYTKQNFSNNMEDNI